MFKFSFRNYNKTLDSKYCKHHLNLLNEIVTLNIGKGMVQLPLEWKIWCHASMFSHLKSKFYIKLCNYKTTVKSLLRYEVSQ